MPFAIALSYVSSDEFSQMSWAHDGGTGTPRHHIGLIRSVFANDWWDTVAGKDSVRTEFAAALSE